MVRFLELIISRGIAAILLLALTGCSSNGSSEILSALWDGMQGSDEVTQDANSAETITRAQIEKLGVALIRVREMRTAEQNLLVAFRQSDQQITYVFRVDRRLVMHGGLIQSTYGFGKNLDPIGVRRDDPVAFPRPVKTWPVATERFYQISDRGTEAATPFTCSYTFGAIGALEIVGKSVMVQSIREACTGAGINFTNKYDVALSSGFIWRSKQWTGATQGSLLYEVLEPLD